MKRSFMEPERKECHALCHPTAIVETDRIGKNVEIEAFCYISKRVVIGDNVKIYQHTILGTPAHVLGKKDYGADLRIGAGTIIREQTTANTPMGPVDSVIGENVFIMASSHISHDVLIGADSIICLGAVTAGHFKCGKHAYLGLNSTMHQNAEIGDYSLIGAGSFFKGKSPRGIIWVGSPARPIKINEVGLHRWAKADERKEIIAEAEEFLRKYK